MSFWDNAKRALGGRDYDDERDYDEEYEDEYEEEEERPRRRLFSFLSKKRDDDYDDYEEDDDEPVTLRRSSSSYPARSTSTSSSTYRSSSARAAKPAAAYSPRLDGVEMTILSPISFDDSSKIVREVKENHITVFDMSGVTEIEEARRIVDYISGAAEGMECQFARICPSVFCLAPKGVNLNNKRPRY